MTRAQTPSMIGMPPSALSAIHRAVSQGRSAAEAAELARRMGFAAGASFQDAFQAGLDRDGIGPAAELEMEEFWTRLSSFFAESGWGELRFERAHPGVAVLTSSDWAEANGRRSRHPACHITTGLLSAMVGRVGGARLAVLEAECRATGAESCTFLVGSQAALQAVFSRMRDGEAYAEAVAALA